MSVKTDIELENFFIFNSLYGANEGEEFKKILFYYPNTDNTEQQIRNVGLVEGIIKFTSTFKPSQCANALHTQKKRQIYYEAEKDFWVVMTLKVPVVTSTKDGTKSCEYLEDEVQNNVYAAVLKQAYLMYRLFSGTYESIIETENVEVLKNKLEHFFTAYLKTLKLANCDILNIFSGIQYLPLDKQTFLNVQCFINLLECNFPVIKYTAFLYNEHLIWSGIEPEDMQTVYQYLISTLLPANIETELQGGSMPRNSSSPFTALHHGRFITGPVDLKTANAVGKVPRVYLSCASNSGTYYMVVYRALSASVCFFMDASLELDLEIFKELDNFISPKMTLLVSDIAEYCYKLQQQTNTPENSPRFIYFNKFNLAYKSSVHLDNKQTGNIACTKDSLKVIADMNAKNSFLKNAGETIVKTMNDYWVVGKVSNCREFYVTLQQKNASLIDISEEIKKLSETELKGIFFQTV